MHGSKAVSQLTTTLSDPGDNAMQEDDFGAAVAISGTTAIVGSSYVNQTEGAVYIYSDASGPWTLETTLSPPGSPLGSCFGCSVAITGTGPGATAIVGAPFGNRNKGGADIYVENAAGKWPRTPTQRLSAPAPSRNDNFGTSVAVSGTGRSATAIVGATGKSSGEGDAFIYSPTSTGKWSKVPSATLSDPRARAGDDFGWSVAISGSGSGATAVVGADEVNSSAGEADIYVEGATARAWPLTATLPDPGSNAGIGDQFGYSVSVAGTGPGATTVIGAPTTSGDGSAYVYVEGATAGTWPLTTTFADPGGVPQDFFGGTVAMSSTGPGATAVISADGNTHNEGVTYVEAEGSTTSSWSPTSLADPGATTHDYFGFAVAVAGSTVIVGSEGFNSFAGAAYIYG
ncbi:MAG TPA: hypothetical protein VID75_14395 [Acidimicrobiales bacterium]|jgi:hypothetical protein